MFLILQIKLIILRWTSQGNVADFGNLDTAHRLPVATANLTRVINMGGTNTSTSTGDVIQFVTIATVGNWTDFGNLTTGRHSGFKSC